jgi:endonuclease/exonuclease/phosphatase family metal-dependent hydrolase
MKILSWNVYNYNRRIDEILAFILSSDSDVICLQEVTEILLERLRENYVGNIAVALDGYDCEKEYYLVTLTKFDVTENKTIQLNDKIKISLIQKLLNWEEALSFQYIDFTCNDKTYRVFNTHLTNGSGASKRLSELQKTVSFFNKNSINIVCGDFNTFTKKSFSWLLGSLYSLKKEDIRVDEINVFNSYFETNSLQDALRGSCTQHLLFLKFKLDYILLPKSLKIINSYVSNNRLGSDHNPISLEI